MRWPAAPLSQPDAAQHSEFDDFLLAMMVTVLCSVACLLVWLSSWAITRRIDASPPHTPHGRRVNFANDGSLSQRRARELGVAQSATWPQMAIPGVYICEDLWCRMGCKFTDYVEEKWVRGINAAGSWPPSPLSRGYNGANVMFYPRMTVIEKHRPFIPREGSHGTYWQPHVKSMMDEGMKLLRERGRSEVVAGKR